ncbi:hypothetical protein M514_22007 [Trichuris suis]|uniref:Uncharacterized protein n=1 Tax=Trichuris suis TaxID=68888 RepID=A0A085N8J9_9BILA|nr:hypothetical protein M513_14356 [Trichuris suis]KFD54377.1 hypothetical protein M513_04720 [Trichuris suis]KFD65795.1 hypothetical protein M514_22007 [Trichuris suis]
MKRDTTSFERLKSVSKQRAEVLLLSIFPCEEDVATFTVEAGISLMRQERCHCGPIERPQERLLLSLKKTQLHCETNMETEGKTGRALPNLLEKKTTNYKSIILR